MDKRKDLHVTHRKSDGKWQILSEGQPKALKLCPCLLYTSDAADEAGMV